MEDPWLDALKKVALLNYHVAASKRNSKKEGENMPVGLPDDLQEQIWQDIMKTLIPFVDAHNLRGHPVEAVYKAFLLNGKPLSSHGILPLSIL